MVSFGSGALGGIFLPLLVLGAIIGSIYYRLADDPVTLSGLLVNFIILGMAGYFSAIVRRPLQESSRITDGCQVLLTPDPVHGVPIWRIWCLISCAVLEHI